MFQNKLVVLEISKYIDSVDQLNLKQKKKWMQQKKFLKTICSIIRKLLSLAELSFIQKISHRNQQLDFD